MKAKPDNQIISKVQEVISWVEFSALVAIIAMGASILMLAAILAGIGPTTRHAIAGLLVGHVSALLISVGLLAACLSALFRARLPERCARRKRDE